MYIHNYLKNFGVIKNSNISQELLNTVLLPKSQTPPNPSDKGLSRNGQHGKNTIKISILFFYMFC